MKPMTNKDIRTVSFLYNSLHVFSGESI